MLYRVTDKAPARLGKAGDRKEMSPSKAAYHVARGELEPVETAGGTPAAKTPGRAGKARR